MRARDSGPLFALEPHVCRHCFGRLLSTDAGTGDGASRRYVCSNCGAAAVGAEAGVLCCCGVQLKHRGAVGALLACAPNPNPTPEMPSQIVAIPVVSDGFNDSKSVRSGS